jgi:hypothetical protein
VKSSYSEIVSRFKLTADTHRAGCFRAGRRPYRGGRNPVVSPRRTSPTGLCRPRTHREQSKKRHADCRGCEMIGPLGARRTEGHIMKGAEGRRCIITWRDFSGIIGVKLYYRFMRDLSCHRWVQLGGLASWAARPQSSLGVLH